MFARRTLPPAGTRGPEETEEAAGPGTVPHLPAPGRRGRPLLPDPGTGRSGPDGPSSGVSEKAGSATTTDHRTGLVGSALTVVMALMFAAVSILGKSILNGHQNAFVILTIRFAGTAGLLFIFVAATGGSLVPEPGEWLGIAIAGIAGYGTEAAFFYGALNHGNAGTVAMLFYTYPVIVMVATIGIERRAPARLLFIALTLAIIGGAIVILGGSGVDIQPIGIVLILCCATGYSGYLIGLDRVIKQTNPMTACMWLAAGAAVANGVFALWFGNNVIPHGDQWWRVAGMAGFTMGAFVCLLASLRRIGAVRNAIIGVLEPLAVALLGAMFLSEAISLSTAIGGCLILGGAIAATLGRTKAGPQPSA